MDKPFVQLGYGGDDRFYFLKKSLGNILSFSSLDKASLLKLANLDFWKALYPKGSGVDWDEATSDMIETSGRKWYVDSQIRGIGAWKEGNRIVFNYGDNAKELSGEVFTYLGHHPLSQTKEDSLSDEEARIISNTIDAFPIKSPTQRLFLKGWLYTSIVAGALDWRPHLWVTAESGSGKSTLINRVIAPLLGDYCHSFGGNSSEAGVRQTLGKTSLAVIHDEAESEDKSTAQEIKKKLELARLASSADASNVVKGTAGGSAMTFNASSSFFFTSIGIPALNKADESRFSVIDMYKRNDRGEYLKLLTLSDQLNKEFCQRYRKRCIELFSTFQQSLEVIQSELRKDLKSARAHDQIGALLAGAWTLENSKVISEKLAKRYVVALELTTFANYEEDEGNKDHYQSFIELSSVTIEKGSIRKSLGDAVREDSRDMLSGYGIRILDKKDVLAVPVNNPKLERAMGESPFAKTYISQLRRIENVNATNFIHPISKKSTACLEIPMDFFRDIEESSPRCKEKHSYSVEEMIQEEWKEYVAEQNQMKTNTSTFKRKKRRKKK